jgi:hypothetical protein
LVGAPPHSIISSAREQRRWHVQTEGLGNLQIDHQLKLCRLLDRQIGRSRAFENSSGVGANLAVGIHDVRIVAHQAARYRIVAKLVDRGERRLCDECN